METLLNIKFDHFRNKHFVRFLGLYKYGTKWFERWILSYILHDIKRRLTFEKILDLLNEFIIDQEKNLWKMTVTKGAQCTLNGDLWDNFLQCIFNTSNYFFKKSNLIRLFDGLFPILLQFWNQISQYISSCCAAGQGKDKAKTKIYAVLYLLIITM